jgi:hypothetical protein
MVQRKEIKEDIRISKREVKILKDEKEEISSGRAHATRNAFATNATQAAVAATAFAVTSPLLGPAAGATIGMAAGTAAKEIVHNKLKSLEQIEIKEIESNVAVKEKGIRRKKKYVRNKEEELANSERCPCRLI